MPNILRSFGHALLGAAARLREVRQTAWRTLKQFKAQQNALLAGEPAAGESVAAKPTNAKPAAAKPINSVVRVPLKEKGAEEFERHRERLMVKPSGLAVRYRAQMKEKLGEEPEARRRVATALGNLDSVKSSPQPSAATTGGGRSRVSLEVHPSTLRGPIIEPDPRWKAMCGSSSLKCR